MDPPVRALIVLAGFIFAIGLGEGLGSAAGVSIRSRLGDGFLGSLDRLGGAVLGTAQGILVIWLAGGILATGAIPPAAAMAQTSIVVRALADALPPPTEFAGGLGKLLDFVRPAPGLRRLRAVPGSARRDAEQLRREGPHGRGRRQHGQGRDRRVRLRAERDGLLDR